MNDKQLKAELARLRAENDRLHDENEALRDANVIVSAMESMRVAASIVFREFQRSIYEGEHDSLDTPMDPHEASDALLMPCIVLRLSLAGLDGEEWSASVECADDIDPEVADNAELVLGMPSATPIAALAALRDALEEEPGEDGVRVTAAMRADLDAYERARTPAPPSGEKPN